MDYSDQLVTPLSYFGKRHGTWRMLGWEDWSRLEQRECWDTSRSLERCGARRETTRDRSLTCLAGWGGEWSVKSRDSRLCPHDGHKCREDMTRCPYEGCPRSSWAWALLRKWALGRWLPFLRASCGRDVNCWRNFAPAFYHITLDQYYETLSVKFVIVICSDQL